MASLLEISLDELFGRQDVPLESLVSGLSRSLYNAPRENRYRIAWEVVCYLQKAIFSAFARVESSSFSNLNSDFRGRSALVMNEGISYLSFGNAPVSVICPQGEGITATDISTARDILSLLADPHVFRAFAYLQTKTYGFLFDSKHLSFACEIPFSEISRVTEAICRLSFAKETILPLNGADRIFYTVTPSEFSVPLLSLLREMDSKTPHVMSGYLRKQPFLDPSVFE